MFVEAFLRLLRNERRKNAVSESLLQRFLKILENPTWEKRRVAEACSKLLDGHGAMLSTLCLGLAGFKEDVAASALPTAVKRLFRHFDRALKGPHRDLLARLADETLVALLRSFTTGTSSFEKLFYVCRRRRKLLRALRRVKTECDEFCESRRSSYDRRLADHERTLKNRDTTSARLTSESSSSSSIIELGSSESSEFHSPAFSSPQPSFLCSPKSTQSHETSIEDSSTDDSAMEMLAATSEETILPLVPPYSAADSPPSTDEAPASETSYRDKCAGNSSLNQNSADLESRDSSVPFILTITVDDEQETTSSWEREALKFPSKSPQSPYFGHSETINSVTEPTIGESPPLDCESKILAAPPADLETAIDSLPEKALSEVKPDLVGGDDVDSDWNHSMDILILTECQSSGPNEETFAKLADSLNKKISDVRDRLLYLMERLEQMEEEEEEEDL